MARNRIVLDSGALTELGEKDGSVRAAIRKALSTGVAVLVPTAVIAEATTGDHRRDANVNRALKKTTLVTLDKHVARCAAELRHAHRKGGAGTIDAIVVATADQFPGARLITGDPADLTLLASVKGLTRVIALWDVR
jgi:predicted nucleic acid-binding protein